MSNFSPTLSVARSKAAHLVSTKESAKLFKSSADPFTRIRRSSRPYTLFSSSFISVRLRNDGDNVFLHYRPVLKCCRHCAFHFVLLHKHMGNTNVYVQNVTKNVISWNFPELTVVWALSAPSPLESVETACQTARAVYACKRETHDRAAV